MTDLVEDDEIARVLNDNGKLQHKLERLVDLAKYAGGKDNITAVLAEIQ
ncbi:MAG: hypothetical protein P8X55_07160 [Desulfosarcinaceae bacterium]